MNVLALSAALFTKQPGKSCTRRRGLINDRLTFKQHDHPTIHPRFQPA
jgi:hypothetical protein